MLQQSDVEIGPILDKFNNLGVNVSFLAPTETGLKKSIIDAIASFRLLLKDNDIHDYSAQERGAKEHGKIVETFLVEDTGLKKTKTSLYRPKTKQGDPRLCIYGLKSYASSGNLLAIICTNNNPSPILYVLNVSKEIILTLLDDAKSEIRQIISNISSERSDIAEELLEKLIKIGKGGPLLSLVNADTGVGRTLESLLGISMNSSKKPDYKGIELKSSRAKRSSKFNLFAQVPDWGLSAVASSNEILELYGYDRGDKRCLRNTTSMSPNAQGLYFYVDFKTDLLHEKHKGDSNKLSDVAVWKLETLRERLRKKHKETFWISADEITRDGNMYFHYTSAKHTRSPLVHNLDALINAGHLVMDHMITSDEGEKGPAFKLKKNAAGLLFPISNTYSLMD